MQVCQVWLACCTLLFMGAGGIRKRLTVEKSQASKFCFEENAW